MVDGIVGLPGKKGAFCIVVWKEGQISSKSQSKW